MGAAISSIMLIGGNMKLALLGTGLMGRPMAARLLKMGHALTAYNRTREKAEPVAEAGVHMADTPWEAVESAECIILMLADAGAIRSLLLPAEGSRPLMAGRTIIQMGTVSPDQSLALKKDIELEGAEYLEAPVLGSFPEVEKGELVVMVGADSEQYSRWAPLLSAFSPEPFHVGPVPKAAALKLALNQLIAALTAAFSLSLGMVQRRNVDPELFMKILRNSALYARQFDKKMDRMLARDFSEPHFPTRHLLKDIRLMLAEGKSVGLETESLEGIEKVVEKAIRMGWKDTDYSSLYNAVNPA